MAGEGRVFRLDTIGTKCYHGVMQFQKLLMSIQNLSMKEQKLALDKKLEEWKGEHAQIDDILVIGIRI